MMRDIIIGLPIEECLRRDCKCCLYYLEREKACLMGVDNCILFPPPEPPVIKGPCCGCPYGRRGPCVSFCMKRILKDWKEERKGGSVYA